MPFFIDLKAALDNVDREKLENILTNKGISEEINERIMGDKITGRENR